MKVDTYLLSKPQFCHLQFKATLRGEKISICKFYCI